MTPYQQRMQQLSAEIEARSLTKALACETVLREVLAKLLASPHSRQVGMLLLTGLALSAVF